MSRTGLHLDWTKLDYNTVKSSSSVTQSAKEMKETETAMPAQTTSL